MRSAEKGSSYDNAGSEDVKDDDKSLQERCYNIILKGWRDHLVAEIDEDEHLFVHQQAGFEPGKSLTKMLINW